MLVCKDNAKNEANTAARVAGSFVAGLTIIGAPIAIEEEKRNIYVLRPSYLQQVINDTRKAMTYDKSSQYVNDKLIRTENTRVTMP